MDLWNRYLLRASGERRFQPETLAEGAAYAVLSWLKERGLHEQLLKKLSEEERSKLVNELADRIRRGMENVLPSPPLFEVEFAPRPWWRQVLDRLTASARWGYFGDRTDRP